MSKAPTIIKDFPGKAVEEYRLRHHGYLPTEELVWIGSLITALRSNLHQKITDVELDELKALAIAGSYAIGQNKVPEPAKDFVGPTGGDKYIPDPFQEEEGEYCTCGIHEGRENTGWRCEVCGKSI